MVVAWAFEMTAEGMRRASISVLPQVVHWRSTQIYETGMPFVVYTFRTSLLEPPKMEANSPGSDVGQ